MPEIVSQINSDVVDCLVLGGVVVLRTDTLYGVVAQAANRSAVQRVYDIKQRDDGKPSIVLVASYDQLFDEPSLAHHRLMNMSWPGPVSIIMPSIQAPDWITRGTKSAAYRMPGNVQLLDLIRTTGPLVVPSANPQGLPPATTVDMAIGYFGDEVDLYVDGGVVASASPSQLLKIDNDNRVERIR